MITKSLYLFINEDSLTGPFDSLRPTEATKKSTIAEKVDFAQLKVLQNEYNITAVLPAKCVSLHALALPNLKNADKVIPYALEEQLASDIDSLHFAYSTKPSDNGLYQVVVVDKQWLQTLIDTFDNEGIELTRIISEQRHEPAAALCHRDTLYLNLNNTPGALNVLQLEELLAEQKEPLNILSFSDTSKELLSTCQTLVQCQVEQSSSTYREYFMQLDTHNPNINCRIGHFGTQRQKKSNLNSFFYALAAVIFTISFAFLSLLTQYAISKHRYLEFKAQNEAIYYYFFPKATAVVSPKFRITQLLTAQSKDISSEPFFTLLNTIEPVLAATNSVTLSSLRYQLGHMTLTIRADDFKALSLLKSQLSKLSITIKQLSATSKNQAVDAIWEIYL